MKKKIIYLSIILVVVISLITLSSIYKSKDNKYKKEYNTISKGMAIMIKEEGATDYVQSNSKDIPKGNYVLNEEKTYCENNGKVTNYNSTTGTVSLNFIGSDRCYLYFDYEVPGGWKTILINNGNGATTVEEAKTYIEGRTTSTTPDFSIVATTNEGMYSAQDDLGTSYYFRGAVDNNWLKYGKYTKDMYNCNNGTISATDTGNSCTKIASNGDDIYWRIIRINGDGSIRMIYSGVTPPTESTKVIKTTDTSLGNGPFNQNYDSDEYIGYMYTIGEQHGTSQSSDIKTYLEDWYANYTDLNKTGTQITDQIFCNDRDRGVGDPPIQYYGAGYRLSRDVFNYGKKEAPILTCPEESDKFTSKGSSIGNKKIEYPVGLITADEVSMAGGKHTTQMGQGGTEKIVNSSYYLYTNQTYWSGSPESFTDRNGSSGNYGAREYIVSSSGALDVSSGQPRYVVDTIPPEDGSDSGSGSGSGSGTPYGVRPVVSLSSKVKLSGNGTYNDVYTVVGDNSTEDTSSDKSFDTVFAANNTDIFNENGYRYEGADPNNYICLDSNKEGACSNSSLLFRIIGLFNEDTSSDGSTSAGTKKLLKVIDTNNYGGTSGKKWNSAGTNNWSTASLKTELNGTYLTTLLGTANVNSKLSSAIANAKWHLGGGNNTSSSNYFYQTITTENLHKAERSPYATSGTLQNLYSGNPEYVFAKVGLMYPSDYGYATVGGTTTNKSSCRAKELYNWDGSSYSDCKNNDWLFTSQSSFVNSAEWLLSPYSSVSSDAARLHSSGYVSHSYGVVGSNLFAVRPTFYLDSTVLKIVGTGDGTKDNAYRVG